MKIKNKNLKKLLKKIKLNPDPVEDEFYRSGDCGVLKDTFTIQVATNNDRFHIYIDDLVIRQEFRDSDGDYYTPSSIYLTGEPYIDDYVAEVYDGDDEVKLTDEQWQMIDDRLLECY